jgi:ABC-type branched-subunit amino acid transport system ATPase component
VSALALLEAQALTKRFGGVTAVDACSFAVPEGTITALVGPNGSGKTTVFNLLTGYVRPDGGGIRFAGRRIRRPSPTALYRKGLTRTFQQARIFPDLTLVENLAAAMRRPWWGSLGRGVRRHERGRALELLHDFRLGDHADRRAGTLSYGQKKLLEFATVLTREPRLVLLDEPTAGVNPVLVDQIEERIRELHAGGITFLVVEHNMDFIMRLCPRVICMVEGRVLAEGPPSVVQSNRQVLDAYLGN